MSPADDAQRDSHYGEKSADSASQREGNLQQSWRCIIFHKESHPLLPHPHLQPIPPTMMAFLCCEHFRSIKNFRLVRSHQPKNGPQSSRSVDSPAAVCSSAHTSPTQHTPNSVSLEPRNGIRLSVQETRHWGRAQILQSCYLQAIEHKG